MFALLAAPAWAGTHIVDTLYYRFSTERANCTLYITDTTPSSDTGKTFTPATLPYVVTNGAVNVELEPNDAASPEGTSYTVQYACRKGSGYSETWVVPTGGPFTIRAVRTSVIPTPSTTFSPLALSSGGASSGQCLVFSGASWVPGSCAAAGAVASIFGRSGTVTAQTGDYTTAQVTESGNLYFTNARARAAFSITAPLTYNAGTGVFGCQTANGSQAGCVSSSDWTSFNGRLLPANNLSELTNQATARANLGLAPIAASGSAADLSGTLADARLSSNVPLKAGTNAYTGTQDAHAATKTLPHRTGTGSPIARDNCATVGETYFQTDATAGSNTFACTATGTPGTWSLQGSGAGGGTSIAPYQSALIAGPDMGKTITGAVHGFTTTALLVAVYDNSNPREAISIGWAVDPSTYDVTIGFAVPQSNYYVVINGGVGPQGPQGIQGLPGVGDMVRANNLSDLINIPTARTNLGLGGAALLNVGTIAGTVAAGNDSRLSDARTPTAHTASHKNGGSDEVATATPAANAIPKAGAGGTLANGWLPGAGYRVCTIDNDTQSATALVTGQVSGGCEFPAASTIIEIQVWGGTGAVGGTVTSTGTSSINLERFTPNGGATASILSGALATVAGFACSATGASCLNGLAKSGSITLSTTAIAAGDWVRVSAATLDGVQTWYRIAIAYTVN